MDIFDASADDWGNAADAVVFRPMWKSCSEKKSDKKRNKKKENTQIAACFDDEHACGDAPVAKEHKVKAGRVEKPKNRKSAILMKEPRLKLTPALAKAASEAVAEKASAPDKPDGTPKPTTSALADKLKAELLGGRFRYINEQLYTTSSKKAASIFHEDKDAFDAYHAGYQHQVSKWPFNPLKRIIKAIKRMPKTHQIGDFGCGEGKLAASVVNKVYSMDLVSVRNDIIACNMTDTPLQARSLDVAVYCLSLMGTNLNDYLLEANRVLKLHGLVHIAEIQSRIEDVRQFVRSMKACGFQLEKKDTAASFFYFFQFRKMQHIPKDAKLPPFQLKPCLYRKR